MPEKGINHYDILIAGAGFAGSIMALVLQKSGLKVCLLEKGRHPRFAIGESSTPIADMILRSLSVKYDLPWLYDFSRYGSWQKTHPEIICGLKRGFSFFKHHPGEDFVTDENHRNELMVAASSSDELSDTNWLRSDFDNFLVTKVKESGIDYFDLTEILQAKKNGEWLFQICRSDKKEEISASFFIDATGSGALAEKLFGRKSSADDFLTNSFAVFSHFTEVPHWTEILRNKKIPVDEFPFDPDWSALHHILDEGWMWMLRFNDERTSIGFVLDDKKGYFRDSSARETWDSILKKYPSVQSVLKDTRLHPQPGKIIRTGRLQRKLEKCFGEGWVSLPHSSGFVDPLFSSGIAFSLSGLEKLLEIINRYWNKNKFYEHLREYEKKIFTEIELADCLIAGCYRSMPYFELFNSWSMLYFTATIAHEQRRIRNESPGYFLNADDLIISKMVYQSYKELLKIVSSSPPSSNAIKTFTEKIKERIEPFNIAGLLDPHAKNMYHHTVAVF